MGMLRTSELQSQKESHSSVSLFNACLRYSLSSYNFAEEGMACFLRVLEILVVMPHFLSPCKAFGSCLKSELTGGLSIMSMV
jgi:hypothetical protein